MMNGGPDLKVATKTSTASATNSSDEYEMNENIEDSFVVVKKAKRNPLEEKQLLFPLPENGSVNDDVITNDDTSLSRDIRTIVPDQSTTTPLSLSPNEMHDDNDDGLHTTPMVLSPDSSTIPLPTIEFRHKFSINNATTTVSSSSVPSGEAPAVYSDSYEDSFGVSWRIMWYPTGNDPTSNYVVEKQVSCYLEAKLPTSDASPKHVNFILGMLCPKTDAVIFQKEPEYHNFLRESPDWGYNSFYSLRDLLSLNESHVHVFAKIEYLAKPPPASTASSMSLWGSNGDYLDYDSKKETGMVGLKNQGATCYMNSLLQTLFHLPMFRRQVYQTPTETDDSIQSVSLALQRVFYRLQTYEKSVSTRELTKSFGWSHMDTFTQHDVQELYRILCDRIEEKMKSAGVENTVQSMFGGVVRSFIRCVNVEFTSARDEDFYDIQLDVKGCANITESFKKYVEVETLDGENQYEAEGHGKQDAEKGLLFKKFPPVLNLQLKRFEYDPCRDGMVKVHDRFEFPEKLDLSQYIMQENGSDEICPPPTYRLHSILVHSGDVHGGHYYVYIRPDPNSEKWYKFDDDRITKIEYRAALDDSFGESATPEECGDEEEHGLKNLYGKRMRPHRSFSSAYMLVYVRETELPDIMKQIESEDIPSALLDRFRAEEKAAAQRQLEADREHLYMGLRVATDSTIASFKKVTRASDFVTWSASKSFKVQKEKNVKWLRSFLSKKLGVPLVRMRLWQCITRENKTTRPEYVITDLDASLYSLLKETSKKHLCIYLQVVSEPYSIESESRLNLILDSEFLKTSVEGDLESVRIIEDDDDNDSSIEVKDIVAPDVIPKTFPLFIKFYDRSKELDDRIEYIGHTMVDDSTVVLDICSRISEHLKIKSDLSVFELITPNDISLVDPNSTVFEAELQGGDILIFQKTEEVVKQAEEDPNDFVNFFSIERYFQNYLLKKMQVAFVPISESHGEEMVLTQPSDTPYVEITKVLALKLGISDCLYLRLYKHSSATGERNEAPLKHRIMTAVSAGNTLYDFTWSLGGGESGVLYYERLEHRITEIESNRVFNVAICDKKTNELKIAKLVVNQDAKVAELFAVARESFGLADHVALRLCELPEEANKSSIDKWYSANELISCVKDRQESFQGYDYLIEVINGEEQLALQEALASVSSDRPIEFLRLSVFSYENSPGGTYIRKHSVPFMTFVTSSDTYGDMKERIRQKLNVDKEEFAKYGVSVLNESEKTLEQIEESEDVSGKQDAEAALTVLKDLDAWTLDESEDATPKKYCLPIGIEYSDPNPMTATTPRNSAARRADQGIVIRQNN